MKINCQLRQGRIGFLLLLVWWRTFWRLAGPGRPQGSYKGSSREELIATAFYAYSVSLVAKAGEVLGEDVDGYRMLYGQIVKAFREMYPEYYTQTEYAVAIQFELAENPQKAAEELAELVKKDGLQLHTGFVGTIYSP